LKGVSLPVWHGEGKFIPKDKGIRKELKRRRLIALQYLNKFIEKPIMEYPLNPNGSIDAIAGICDETGG